MLINTVPINSGAVNGSISSGPSALLSIEKNILESIQVSGSLLSIEKNITTSQDSMMLLSIEKYIYNQQANTFYIRNGWEPIVVVGNKKVPANTITGAITVTKQEDDNHQAEINLLMPPKVYNLYDYQGKAVQISIRKGGAIYRLFTGKVDVPKVDVLDEKLTLNCVADRRELISNLSSIEPYVGYYSATVLGQSDITYDRMQSRLSTIPASLDFDSYNNYSINSWTPKVAADFTYGSGAVYRRDPQLIIESSGKVINKVNLKMEYGYQRHYHVLGFFNWTHSYAPTNTQTGEGNICPFLFDRPTVPTREMISSAVGAAGWPLMPQTMYFGEIFRSGSYRCGGAWYMWSTAQSSYSTEDRLNPDGTPATDPNGNKVIDVRTNSITDYANILTMSAQWTASKRFDQNVKETYNVTVTAPTSVSRYTLLESESNVSYSAKDNYPDWENYEAYTDPPAGVVTHGVGSYYFNADQDRPTFNNAFLCALHKAQTDILRSHRDTRIVFQRDITPTIELKHTVALSGKWVKGKGKVSRIAHIMSVGDSNYGTAGEAYTEVTALQYRDNTSITNTALNPPAAPVDGIGNPPQVGVILGNHLGEDPEQSGSELWNGYIGNITKQVFTGNSGNYVTTQYQESFVVDTPEIPATLRNDRTLVQNNTYNVDIPSDNTTYESYG